MTYIGNKDYYLEMAKGNIPGHTYLFKYGYNNTVGTTEHPIWDGGGAYLFLASAELINIVSDSINDTSVGTGARTMIIYGLDSNWAEINEVITLTGTTPVQTTKSYLRLNRAIVLTSGTESITADANEGTITFISQDTANLQAQMQPLEGQTLMAIYTIPAGKTGYLAKASMAVGKGRECDFNLRIRNGPGMGNAFSTKYKLPLYENALLPELKVPLAIPEKTDLALTAKSALGSVPAGGSFGIILVDNPA